jgi:hypothetical protein
MIIQQGDILISKLDSYDYGGEKVLTKYRKYPVIFAIDYDIDKSICILDDLGMKWYFGQIGYMESWDNFFYTISEFNRIKKLEELLKS